MRVPKFLKFDPIEYKADSFEPTKWDTDNANSAKPIPAIRYRRDPVTGKMESNANIYRWSDGSVTMAVGDEHFQIQTKDLAPPPKKAYNELKDAHYYAAAANLSSNTLLVVGHLTEQYSVQPNRDVDDEAIVKLQQQFKEAAEEKNTEIVGMITEDPELQKKQAELAEKERNRAQRKREAAAARMDGVGNRTHRGALSIGDLEGGRRGASGGRKRGAGGQPKKQRRNNEYDSDDDLPGGVGRHDDYVEDDFVVGSDEEEEGGDDDEEEEILDDDDDEEEEEAPKRKRQRTADAEDEDAEGEDDEDAPAQSKHRRARRVVDDEEDDE
jgi:RNA polymerase-associated protein LEO1